MPGLADHPEHFRFGQTHHVKTKWPSVVSGFLLLFVVYHLPEFFSAFWVAAVFKIGFLILSFAVARWQGLKGLQAYGLGLKKGWLGYLLRGIMTGIFFYSLSILLSVLFKYESISGKPDLTQFLSRAPMIVLMTAIPSLAEDILTRGYLIPHLMNRLRANEWILLSAAVFVLNHIWRLNDGLAIISYLFILGISLALVVGLTKSLWLAFGIHWGANICFESSSMMVPTQSTNHDQANTWILALSYLLLFIFLILTRNTMKPLK